VRGCEIANVAACANGAITMALPNAKLTAVDFLIDMFLSSYFLARAQTIAEAAQLKNRKPQPMRIVTVITCDYRNRDNRMNSLRRVARALLILHIEWAKSVRPLNFAFLVPCRRDATQFSSQLRAHYTRSTIGWLHQAPVISHEPSGVKQQI
jgi:hypothetical protein